jgi:hypothetical protein
VLADLEILPEQASEIFLGRKNNRGARWGDLISRKAKRVKNKTKAHSIRATFSVLRFSGFVDWQKFFALSLALVPL